MGINNLGATPADKLMLKTPQGVVQLKRSLCRRSILIIGVHRIEEKGASLVFVFSKSS